MPTTLQNIKLDIWRLFAYRDEAMLGMAVPFTTSSVAGAATAIRDTALDRGTIGASATRFNGREVEILETVASGPAAGETSRITDGGYDGTDALTVSPAFSATPQTGTDYLLWPRGLSTPIVEDEVNRILRSTEAPHPYYPSLAADADFASGGVTNWAAVGTPTARSLTTTAANIFAGEAALRITTDAADEGATSNTFAVTENEQLVVAVVAQVDVDSLTVVLRRITTTAADIDSITLDEELFTEGRIVAAIPDGCEEAAVRLLGTANGSDFYVSSVIVQSNADRLYPLPSWFTSRSQIEGAFYKMAGTASEANNSYVAGLSHRPADVEIVRGDRWATPFYVRLRCPGSDPVGLWVKRPFSEFTAGANTSTTPCDREYLTKKAAANIMEMIGPRDADDMRRQRRWNDRADEIAEALEYGSPQLVIEPNPKVAV